MSDLRKRRAAVTLDVSMKSLPGLINVDESLFQTS